MDSEAQDRKLFEWVDRWELIDHILPKTTYRNIEMPEINLGSFYFVDGDFLYNTVAELMLHYESHNDALSFLKLEWIGKHGDWLARAKSWTAISDLEPNALFDNDLLSYTTYNNENREQFLKKIASGIDYKLRTPFKDVEKESIMQAIITGQKVNIPITVIAQTKKAPSELDLWFGDKNDRNEIELPTLKVLSTRATKKSKLRRKNKRNKKNKLRKNK